MDKRDHARFYASNGFRVFPVLPGSKVPATREWPTRATTDLASIDEWWHENPDYNIGIATGNGVVAIDADVKDGKPGLQSLELMELELGVPAGMRTKTPSGGLHVLLKSDRPIRNRANTLAGYPGIDIRGDGGYVLGAGSFTDEGPRTVEGLYVLNGSRTLQAAPDAFYDMLAKHQAAHKPHTAAPITDLDDPLAVSKAISYLEGMAPSAIEGDGGDDTTFRVAARLRDYGLSESLALELMLDRWNETKAVPPWMPDELQTKVGNAYRFATGTWGGSNVHADFGIVEGEDAPDFAVPVDFDEGRRPSREQIEKASAGKPRAKSTMHFLTYDEMRAMPEPAWLVEGVVQQRTGALVFGKSNTFKSFLAVDIGLSVATGRQWHGNPVSQGKVLFVATEGANGVGRLRVPGWYDYHDVPEDQRCNAFLFPKEIRLDLRDDVDALVAAANAIGGFALIVFDIFGGTMSGSEIEDTTARAWVHNIQHIMRETGAATLTVAHTGWQDETRARMHTHFWGSFDSRLRVDGDKEKRTTCLTVERHKDSDSSGSWGFALDTAGETLVPVFDETIKPEKGAAWPDSLKKAMAALGDATEKHGVLKLGEHWPSCKVVDIATWREVCDEAGLSSSEKADTRKKAFNRAREGLQQRKAIDVHDGFAWSVFDA